MGFLFSSKKAIGPTPKLPDAPAVPDQKALDAAERERMRNRQRDASSGATLLTTAQGLTSKAETNKTVLG